MIQPQVDADARESGNFQHSFARDKDITLTPNKGMTCISATSSTITTTTSTTSWAQKHSFLAISLLSLLQ